MAGGHSSSVGLSTCKRCKSNVVNAIKCRNCENSYHLSCAKLCTNVKFSDSGEIICCEILNPESDNGFFDALDELSSTGKKVDMPIFSYIIKQKDLIIQELREKIDLLHKHIDMLNIINQHKSNSEESQLAKVKTSSNTKTISNKNTNNTDKNDIEVNRHTVAAHVNKQGNSRITKNDVSSGIMRAETENKMNKYIHLVKDGQNGPPANTSNHNNKDEANDWKLISNTRRKRKMIVGNNKDSSSVKGVPKLVSLHVYRINKNTTTDELTTLLKDNFQEVVCEQINSKHPEIYSSFKVSILEDNFAKAMNPNVWPYGACVSRFFRPKKESWGASGEVNLEVTLETINSTKHKIANTNSVSIFHVNIQCISNKIDQLSIYLNLNNYTVACISEHWQEESKLGLINLPGYSLANYFCRNDKEHGGVSIFVKQNMKVKPIDVNSFCTAYHAEFCAIEISDPKILVINLYRSPIGRFEFFLNALEELLTKYYQIYKRIILIGDFNVDFRGNSLELTDLVCLSNSYGLDICISEYTRVTQASSTCIDNVWTSFQDGVIGRGWLNRASLITVANILLLIM
ncbi:hypothetical protein NQ317_000182 [Molorchus minor]|uniref:Endonuclease/exonuclease/phosphatase domain-containing protein n=1 Tax=Molorchus minor TaxID=1323400 RepID=A0ABQ9IQ09_9CUCU|nr:hypothetical protein NQ317_000182 [Molorchus minor]